MSDASNKIGFRYYLWAQMDREVPPCRSSHPAPHRWAYMIPGLGMSVSQKVVHTWAMTHWSPPPQMSAELLWPAETLDLCTCANNNALALEICYRVLHKIQCCFLDWTKSKQKTVYNKNISTFMEKSPSRSLQSPSWSRNDLPFMEPKVKVIHYHIHKNVFRILKHFKI